MVMNSEEKTSDNDSKKVILTTSEKCKLFLSNITVEPIMVCYVLPNAMQSMAMQNVHLEKACRVDLAYNSSVCDKLIQHNSSEFYKSEEMAVQQLVASAMITKSVIQSLIPSIILMYFGSWTDRHERRKPAILIPILAEMITTILFALCTYFFYELPLIYNVLSESIPPSLSGGLFAVFMGVFSYVGARTDEKTRTLRIGVVSMVDNISLIVGIACSGILYKKIGVFGVLWSTFFMYIIGLIYGFLRIKEKPKKQFDSNEKQKSFLRDFFDSTHIKETMKVAFKKEERNRRKIICTILILMMVIVGPLYGEMNVIYIFTRYKYKWDEVDFSLFSTFGSVVHMAGTLFSLMFFSKFLKLDDALIGVISSLSKIASCFVYAFAPNTTIFYLGAIFEMLNGTSFIAMRSIISKLVPANELGKINSLFGVSEALMPLMYGPLYSFVYKVTINVFPGAFFLVGGFLTVPAVLIFLWLYMEQRKSKREIDLNKAQTEILLNEL